jgi:hypothetical protein
MNGGLTRRTLIHVVSLCYIPCREGCANITEPEALDNVDNVVLSLRDVRKLSRRVTEKENLAESDKPFCMSWKPNIVVRSKDSFAHSSEIRSLKVRTVGWLEIMGSYRGGRVSIVYKIYPNNIFEIGQRLIYHLIY